MYVAMVPKVIQSGVKILKRAQNFIYAIKENVPVIEAISLIHSFPIAVRRDLLYRHCPKSVNKYGN
jgi:hypothetical protein